MKQHADSQIVQTALASVQALIKKPPKLFDQYAAMAALEHLVNVEGTRRRKKARLFYACAVLWLAVKRFRAYL